MHDRYHTYNLAQSRNILNMACMQMSACGRRSRCHRRVPGGAAAPEATMAHRQASPSPPRAASRLLEAPNDVDLVRCEIAPKGASNRWARSGLPAAPPAA